MGVMESTIQPILSNLTKKPAAFPTKILLFIYDFDLIGKKLAFSSGLSKSYVLNARGKF
jgi:hypothetical protein